MAVVSPACQRCDEPDRRQSVLGLCSTCHGPRASNEQTHMLWRRPDAAKRQKMSKVQSKGPRVIIIGGSMGGLFAGLFFRKAGWNARIFERVAEPLNARGAGIATH